MKEICICPVCRRKFGKQVRLAREAKRLYCKEGHSFDISAKGYVNLLSPSAGSHGDNRDMVLARGRLLNSGIYAPFRDALVELLSTLPAGATVWDSGCGEGYYTSAAAEYDGGFNVYGSDLSTIALSAAHKRCPSLSLVAASSYALPAGDSTCDALLCLFAPEAADEFLRILKPGGALILGIPGKRHLFGLKELLYDTPYENAPHDPSLTGFLLIENREIKYNVTIDDPTLIRSLFEMTPYAYRTGTVGRQRLQAVDTLHTELHFHLLHYQKTPNS
ncbi:MAG: methyltransferase domain-containing protein [Clostridia bacterium]|nr:methyltransferase domain-containing protein [Clostridia bacterium]